MLPSASRDGATSRIVPRLDGPVTTLREGLELQMRDMQEMMKESGERKQV